MLQLGEYLHETGDVEKIRSLYYEDGTGYFTPEGHQFVADAVYRCFYAAEPGMSGCMLTGP
jgi:hypothetical protein